MAAERQSNPRLRDVIAATGWTYEALARTVRRVAAENGEDLRTNKSAVAHWVDGARPSGRCGQYLVEALSRRAGRVVSMAEIGLDPGGWVAAVEDPVAAAVELGRADVDRRGFLVAAVFTVAGVAMPLGYDHEAVSRMLRARVGLGFVGDKDIDVVRDITAAFSAADELLGGGHGLTTVTAYLADTAAPMLRARFPLTRFVAARSGRWPSWRTWRVGSTTISGRRVRLSGTTRWAISWPARPTRTVTPPG